MVCKNKNVTKVTLNKIKELPVYVPDVSSDAKTWAEKAEKAAKDVEKALEEIKDIELQSAGITAITGMTTQGVEVITEPLAEVSIRDARGENVSENDFWNESVSFNGKQIQIFKDTTIGDNKYRNKNVVSVDDNKVTYLDGSKNNIQTDKLISGVYMFADNPLIYFDMLLDSLEIATGMFSNTNFEVFNTKLSKLTKSDSMFEGCVKLKQFYTDLTNVVNADNMFNGCVNLEHFAADLSSLQSGKDMFKGCKLSPESLLHLATSIAHIDNETDLGEIGLNGEISEEAYLDYFVADSIDDIKAELNTKGWIVNLKFN